MTSTDLNINYLEPKIYVACLAAYSAGHLHGVWINVTQSEDAINKEIRQMLAKSPVAGAEEWAIHDYEGFGGIHLEEYEDTATLVKMAKIIEEHDELGAAAIAYHDNCPDSAKNALIDYCGEFDSEADYARQFVDDCYDIPKYLHDYINYEDLAENLFLYDYYSIDVRDKCHVFPN